MTHAEKERAIQECKKAMAAVGHVYGLADSERVQSVAELAARRLRDLEHALRRVVSTL